MGLGRYVATAAAAAVQRCKRHLLRLDSDHLFYLGKLESFRCPLSLTHSFATHREKLTDTKPDVPILLSSQSYHQRLEITTTQKIWPPS